MNHADFVQIKHAITVITSDSDSKFQSLRFRLKYPIPILDFESLVDGFFMADWCRMMVRSHSFGKYFQAAWTLTLNFKYSVRVRCTTVC